MIKTTEKAMRIRQGVLKAKVYLKDATAEQEAHYNAIVKHYGRSWVAGRVAQKIINDEERQLIETAVDIVESIIEILVDARKKPVA